MKLVVPPSLTVGPTYGLIVLTDQPLAARFALFVGQPSWSIPEGIYAQKHELRGGCRRAPSKSLTAAMHRWISESVFW
jgi:hypothetical protein